MTESVTVVMMGDPVPYARTRRSGGTGHAFTPPKQRNAAAAFRVLAQQAMAGRIPFDEPIELEFVAEFAIPQTWSKKKQAAARAGEIWPGKKPDLSNLIKLCEDAGNAMIWRDDALIVLIIARKVFGTIPKVSVTARPAVKHLASIGAAA